MKEWSEMMRTTTKFTPLAFDQSCSEDNLTNIILATHCDGCDFFPRNIVSTVNLGCTLNLKTIAMHARTAEYNPKRFAAVIMRIRLELIVAGLNAELATLA